MTVPAKIRIAVIAALALCAPLAAQDRLAEDLAQYQHETDPVRKARALAKLGDEQVDLAKKQLKAEDEVASLHTLEQYRDEVQDTVAALNAMGVDAERKPAGFKELQISLRETIRRIDDLILTLNVDKRPFFRAVRNDLFMDQNELDRRALSAQAGTQFAEIRSLRCPMRSITIPGAVLLLASILSAVPAGMANAAPQKKEYLSEAEADKIRDAGATGPRIVLFATFASDRIKKLQYEFAHIDPDGPEKDRSPEQPDQRLHGLHRRCRRPDRHWNRKAGGHSRRREGAAGGDQGIPALPSGPGR